MPQHRLQVVTYWTDSTTPDGVRTPSTVGLQRHIDGVQASRKLQVDLIEPGRSESRKYRRHYYVVDQQLNWIRGGRGAGIDLTSRHYGVRGTEADAEYIGRGSMATHTRRLFLSRRS
jgi:hypothetical protein